MVVLGVASCLVYFGYINFLRGFSSFACRRCTPIASLYAAIPIGGALIVCSPSSSWSMGWRNGFDHHRAAG